MDRVDLRAGRADGRTGRSDLVSGAALFVFALVYGVGARGLAVSGDPGVALVPVGLAAALAALSGGIALSGWRKLRSAAPASDSPGEEGSGFIRRPGSTRAWGVIGLTVLYAALFQALGHLLATLLYTAAVAERFGAARRTILVLAPCATLLTFLLFRVVLGARLPAGLLG